jgi:hypothetical protein
MTTSSKTNKELKEIKKGFEEKLSEYVSWELEGTTIENRLERRNEFWEWIQTAISQAKEAGRKKCAYCEKGDAEVCYDCAECKAEHV